MKVGILTHYYHTCNYGGILQAYALVRFLRENGYDAEQICFRFHECTMPFSKCKIIQDDIKQIAPDNALNKHTCLIWRVVRGGIRRIIHFRRYWKNWLYSRRKRKANKYLAERQEKFYAFGDVIPHSGETYDNDTVVTINGYDAYITGSDQVWNFDWFTPAFFLENIDNGKPKIAYAASCGHDTFTAEEKNYLKTVLPHFSAISVREDNMADMLEGCTGAIIPEHVVDPVFLLDKDEWSAMASPRLINKPYLLCYFLGADAELYALANTFAQKHHLKLVSIPSADGGNFWDNEIKIKGECVKTASPADFVSLLQNSEIVFTDSFHATAFSLIFQRPFYAFERQNMKKMGSRIRSITKLYGCEDRYCDSALKRDILYLESCSKQTRYGSNKAEKMLEQSKHFLLKALEQV